MCRLCEHGHKIYDDLYKSGMDPADAIHVLTTALANVIGSSCASDQTQSERVQEVAHVMNILLAEVARPEGATLQ
jgi:hypothetical protein